MDPQDSRGFTKSDLESMLLDEAAEPRALPFSLLEEITNSFSYKHEIGRGGFAVVYKGVLDNEVVAVKRLSNTYMYETEFLREVECLMKVKHKNIVRFLGYCSDTQGNMQMHKGKLVMADVQERLLCFEYLPNGSLEGYIEDASDGLEWETRYEIIKGICEGIHSLHNINIMHLDLKPSNILMDDTLVPKITDFGLSRSLGESQTRVVATKMFGTMGYLAPEFTSHVITHKFDLYSLGVIIMELLTGKREFQAIEVEDIVEIWGKRMALSQPKPHWEEIRLCAEIAIECTNFEPAKRPVSMKHVMDMLAEMESMEYYSEQLEDHLLLKHRFYPKLGQSIPCSLHLTNKTDKHVAFRIMKRGNNSLRYFSLNSMYGVAAPRSDCTWIGTREKKRIPIETGTHKLVLQSIICGAKRVMSYQSDCNEVFKKAQELGHAVHEVALKTFYTPSRGETTSSDAVRPTMTNVRTTYFDHLKCLDAHPTEPWIVIGHLTGNVSVWNHESQTTMTSFETSSGQVECIKFHPTKKLIVALNSNGLVYVYDCDSITNIQKITSFRVQTFGRFPVSIHPTKPYVMSAKTMKLWDGDKGWECRGTFGKSSMVQLAFNPEDPNSFVCTSWNNNVKVWSLDPPKCEYNLNGHVGLVNCLDFFRRDDLQYLITGSDDWTAKVWDLQKRACIHTIGGFMSPVQYVISIPGRPYLVTFSHKGVVHVWSSIDFRLKITVNFSGGGVAKGLTCLMGSRRIAIGQSDALYIMDIDDEEESVAEEGNNQDSDCATGSIKQPVTNLRADEGN